MFQIAKELKSGRGFWERPQSAYVGGLDLSDPRRVVEEMKMPRDAQNAMEAIRHEFNRPIYRPADRHSVLVATKPKHRDYSHVIHMPGLRVTDDYRKHAMESMPLKEDLEKQSRHFFRFGLMADFEQDIKLSKHIQVRRYKNLIEVVVDGPKVREKELFVLAHFLSKRPGRLYAAVGTGLKFIYDIQKGSTASAVGNHILKNTQQNIQHFVIRPHHHTRGHPIGGSLARSATYKHALGGKLRLDDVGEGVRKVGRTAGKTMAIAGAMGMAAAPAVAVFGGAPAGVGTAAVSGGVGAAGLILYKGTAKHADMSELTF